MRFINKLFLVIIVILLIGCDGGLAPPVKSYISGLITYKGGISSWPPVDSVKEIRVIAFKTYPPTDIIGDVISGNAFFTPDSLPRFVDTCSYYFEITNTPVNLPYIVVVQRYGTILEWKAIGVYTKSGNKKEPSGVSVNSGVYIKNIDIEVDFNDLPPQPE